MVNTKVNDLYPTKTTKIKRSSITIINPNSEYRSRMNSFYTVFSISEMTPGIIRAEETDQDCMVK